MVAKVGIGILGLGVCSLAGIAISRPGLLGLNFEPNWSSLSKDSDFNSKQNNDYSTTKLGGKYKNYLVGMDVGNKKWWIWSFDRLVEDNKTIGKFSVSSTDKKVTEGYGAGNTSLNNVCNDAYKTEYSSGFSGDDSKFNLLDVWKYCSSGKPVTIADNKDSVDAEESDKSKLISVVNGGNNWFWRVRDEEFWLDSGEKSGSKGASNSIFKKEYDANKSSSRRNIWDLCKEAYSKLKTDTNSKTDALKFCVLD